MVVGWASRQTDRQTGRQVDSQPDTSQTFGPISCFGLVGEVFFSHGRTFGTKRLTLVSRGEFGWR
ncbi:hypothetical protein BAG01nite_30630 [Brevibacillus agri]|uniref:Uncharacterized protein n=1 Tax=Brevibacillus agri TaxID=51101 RepID=A0ABQ0ST54_9BACL|nr:hypothetical protein BAG01nite_30630 [Brevibacillus agri]